MEEVWKSVPGYEGFYEVSTLGTVRSKDRVACNGQFYPGRTLKQTRGKNGYLHVSFSVKGVRKLCYVHQLVAMAFLGHTPCGYRKVVDHLNNIRSDNRVGNLQITDVRTNSSKDAKGTLPTGVNFNKRSKKKPYRARIQINGVRVHLGSFPTVEEAHQAYLNKLQEIT